MSNIGYVLEPDEGDITHSLSNIFKYEMFQQMVLFPWILPVNQKLELALVFGFMIFRISSFLCYVLVLVRGLFTVDSPG